MFTGIIREVGRVAALTRRGGVTRLTVEAPGVSPALEPGGSVAVSGVCQTVIAHDERTFTVEVVAETLRRTTMGTLRRGDRVNLELPLAAGQPLGGHLVAGHVDGAGRVTALRRDPRGYLITVSLPPNLRGLVVEKGSLALDGVSLTVASLRGREATVAIIPHTRSTTTLASLTRGSRVNLEADLIARHLAGLATGTHTPEPASSRAGKDASADTGSGHEAPAEITMEWLRERGYGRA